MVTTYFMDQTSTIHSVDIGFKYTVFKLSFSKQYKTYCFNRLCQGFSNIWCYGAHEEIDHNLRSPTI